MAIHAVFSASAASRWLACPGSVALSQGASGSGASRASAEGTLLHALSEQLLRHGGEAEDFIGQDFTQDGFEFTIDDEQALAVRCYVEYVRGFTGTAMYEVRSDYSDLLGLPKGEGFGTSDCVIYQEETKQLHVIDAKFGRNFVSATENKQLTLYAAGTLTLLQAVGYEVENVTLHILQPRVTATPTPYSMTVEELYAVVESFKEPVALAKEAMEVHRKGGNLLPYLVMGEAQCQWCPAKAVCPTLIKLASKAAMETADAVLFYPSSKLAEAYANTAIIEGYLKAVETEILRRLNEGQDVEGYKLVLGREGNRKWADEAQTVALLSSIKTVPEEELWNPRSPRTLAQVEKVLKKHKVVGIDLAQYQTRAPAKPTIAEASDPRPAWSEASQIDDEFSAL